MSLSNSNKPFNQVSSKVDAVRFLDVSNRHSVSKRHACKAVAGIGFQMGGRKRKGGRSMHDLPQAACEVNPISSCGVSVSDVFPHSSALEHRYNHRHDTRSDPEGIVTFQHVHASC